MKMAFSAWRRPVEAASKAAPTQGKIRDRRMSLFVRVSMFSSSLVAAEVVTEGRIASRRGERRRRRIPGEEEVEEELDGIGYVEDAIVVRVGGVRADGRHTLQEEVLGDPDGVGEVHLAVPVEVAAGERRAGREDQDLEDRVRVDPRRQQRVPRDLDPAEEASRGGPLAEAPQRELE